MAEKNETAEQFAARRRKEYVAALKEEREALERVGKTDRVAQVDEQIKHWSKRPTRTTADQAADQQR